MYYTNIANDEVKQFHKQVKLNSSFIELTLISPYLIRKQGNKLLPTFYSDKIVCEDKYKVLDDLVILVVDDSDLQNADIDFISENVINDFNVFYSTFKQYGYSFLKLHFYNTANNYSVPNFKFYFEQGNGVTGDYVTDDYGNVIIELDYNGDDEFTIVGNGKTINISVED